MTTDSRLFNLLKVSKDTMQFATGIISFWIIFVSTFIPAFMTYHEYQKFYVDQLERKISYVSSRIVLHEDLEQESIKLFYSAYPSLVELVVYEDNKKIHHSILNDSQVLEQHTPGDILTKQFTSLHTVWVNDSQKIVIYHDLSNTNKSVLTKEITTGDTTSIVGMVLDISRFKMYETQVSNMMMWNLVFSTLCATIVAFIVSRFYDFLVRVRSVALSKVDIVDRELNVFTRIYLDAVIKKDIKLAMRHRYPVGIIMFSLNGLSKLPSVTRQQVLQDVIGMMSNQLREDDTFAIYDNKKYIIVCPYTSEEDTVLMRNRLTSYVDKLDLTEHGQHIKITVQIGATEFKEDIDLSIDMMFNRLETIYRQSPGK